MPNLQHVLILGALIVLIALVVIFVPKDSEVQDDVAMDDMSSMKMEDDESMAHTHDNGSAHVHDHNMLLEVVSSVPTIDVTVHEGVSGYNVSIETTNFTFTPENVDEAHVDNEGHAHIYVDGVKINRMYGEWYHLSSLGDSGEHIIRVELSTNDHKTYAFEGEKIDDTVVVTIP